MKEQRQYNEKRKDYRRERKKENFAFFYYNLEFKLT